MPRFVRAALTAMVVAACLYVPLDWWRLHTHIYRMDVRSNAAKLVSSFLAAAIACALPAALALDAQDKRRFATLFTIVAVADSLFMLHLEPLGIGLFMIFHAVLIARNLTGMKRALDCGAVPGWGAGAALTVLAALALYARWLLPQVREPELRVGIPIYICVVWASAAAAWASVAIGYFPRRNALRMGIGMTLFLLCDLSVGCNLVWNPDGAAQVSSSSVTWMLYAPALALIATSAYRHNTGSPAARAGISTPTASATPMTCASR